MRRRVTERARGVGSVVVDELILPITDVRLEGGSVVVSAHAEGPLDVMPFGAQYAVFDGGGNLVWRGKLQTSWKRHRAGDALTLKVWLDVQDKLTNSARV